MVLIVTRRCEPTYEELKHELYRDITKQAELLRAYLWGIETSINPQVLGGKASLRAYLWGIETLKLLITQYSLLSCEPTYEELKHDTNFKLYVDLYQLRAYLWGIETLPRAEKL